MDATMFKQVKKRSIKQEKNTARELCGRLTPASGARWHSKGDIRTQNFLVECKATEKDYYNLNYKVWDKIKDEAVRDGLRTPVMRIDLQNKYGDIVSLAVISCFIYYDGIESVIGTKEKLLVTQSSKRSVRLDSNSTYTCIEFTETIKQSIKLAIIPWEVFLTYAKTIN